MSSVCSQPRSLIDKLTLILMVAIVGSPVRSEMRGSEVPDCLNSTRNQEEFELSKHSECTHDIAKLSDYQEVNETEKILGLTSDEITFIGCAAAPFRTRMADLDPPFRFEILYTADTSSARLDYVAPILHELGHVYQLKKARSPHKLLESPIERRELGADFLAGLAAAKMGIKNPTLFERTLSLVGSYKAKSDSHGTPENRTQAFRYGYFYRPISSSVDSTYSYFQDNLFSQVMHH
jgi:hypothetical protein